MTDIPAAPPPRTEAEVERRTREVEDQIASTCGVLNAASADLVRLTKTVLDEGLWKQSGIVSPAHYLRWKAGLGVAQSERIVRLARQLEPLPATRAAFERGELSMDQAAVVARHVPPSHDASAAGMATKLMVPQLNAHLARYPFERDLPMPEPASGGGDGADEATGPEAAAVPPDPPEEQVREHLSFGFREDGTWTIAGRLSPERAAPIDKLLRVERDRMYRERRRAQGADGPPIDITWVDVLERVADIAATSPGTARSVRERYRANYHLDVETLEGWERGRRPALHLGPLLPKSFVDQITCDGKGRLILEERSLAVAYGPWHATIPDHIRTRIEDRDRRCRAAGCGSTVGLEVHHLVPRSEGGWTIEQNLVLLCSRHHRLHHQGELAITGDPTKPDGLTFTNRHGVELLPTPPNASATPRPGSWHHPPGERVDTRWFQIDPDPPPPPEPPAQPPPEPSPDHLQASPHPSWN